MHRRTVLLRTAGLMAATATGTLLAACGQRHLDPLAPAAPTTAPTPPPAVADARRRLTETATRAVGPLVAELAQHLGAQPVAPSFDAWLGMRPNADREFLVELRDNMALHGFVGYDMSRVFQQGDIFFYLVGNEDGLNACTPYLVASGDGKVERGAMVEAPLAMGLTFLAREWDDRAAPAAADALIPRAAIHDEGMSLGRSLTSPPYVYRTRAGQILFNYEADDRARTGLLSLTVNGPADRTLIAREYRVAWG